MSQQDNVNKFLLEFMLGAAIKAQKNTPDVKEPKEKLNVRQKNNGLTLFYYGEKEVWALNKKTADKKAKKLGYI